jgi:hypothetical protein
MHEHPIIDTDIRVSFPSPIVQQMLQYRALLTWQPDTLVHIKTFRAILAVCIN